MQVVQERALDPRRKDVVFAGSRLEAEQVVIDRVRNGAPGELLVRAVRDASTFLGVVDPGAHEVDVVAIWGVDEVEADGLKEGGVWQRKSGSISMKGGE